MALYFNFLQEKHKQELASIKESSNSAIAVVIEDSKVP